MRALLLMTTGLGSIVMTTFATALCLIQLGRTFEYASITALILMLPQIVGISFGITYLEDKEKERKTK